MAIVKCKRCNEKYSDVLRECLYCENDKKYVEKKSNKKLIIGIILIVFSIISVVIWGYMSSRCKYKDCYNTKNIYGVLTNYCNYHENVIAEVINSLVSDSGTSSTSTTSGSSLVLKNVELDKDTYYYKASGSLSNYGSKTAKFVKVKVQFKSYYGSVIDTDWTYAVGSEGIAPGETVKWSCSVEKDYDIDDVVAEIIDYDY